MSDTDFELVVTCETPTEAFLLRGVLESSGIQANVADANLVQAHSFLTQAVGGVRVLVPSIDLQEARRVIAEYRAGSFELPAEASQEKPPPLATLPQPVFSPDGIALWSLALTPLFGTVVHLLNGGANLATSRVSAWLWCAFAAACTTWLTLLFASGDVDPTLMFRVSLVLWLVTAPWYFFVAYPESRRLLQTYGSKYPRRPLRRLGISLVVCLASGGWLLESW